MSHTNADVNLDESRIDSNTKWQGGKDTTNSISNNSNEASVNKGNLIDHWNQNHIEIVAILEGVDPTSSGALQARHSYLACGGSSSCNNGSSSSNNGSSSSNNGSSSSSEVIWHKTFAPCVFHDSEDGTAVIDFSKFHDTY